MASDLLRGHLDLLVLGVLADGPLHGYELIAEMRRRSGGAIDPAAGTLYPALYRLEASGMLSSRLDDSTGQRRRIYRLTPRGKEALEHKWDEWRRFVHQLSQIVG